MGGSNCDFDSEEGLLTYNLSPAQESDDGVFFSRNPVDDSILVYSSFGRDELTPCLGEGEPTVFNVDTIQVNGSNASPSDTYRIGIDLSGGLFAPGKTDEPGSSDEIEFQFDIAPNTHTSPSELRIIGGTAGDNYAFGDRGINLNPTEAGTKDIEMRARQIGRLLDFRVFSGGGSDLISVDGRAGTGDPWFNDIDASLGERNDRFLAGRFNQDILVHGGLGRDLVDFSALPEGVVVDLEELNTQPVGQFFFVENAVGSRFDDELMGTSSRNALKGGGGDDRLLGRAGNDRLDGGADVDDCRGGPGDDDLVRCE